MRVLSCLALLVVFVLTDSLGAVEPPDTREYWVYEGGWFAKDRSGWYEMNEESHRLGKPWRFDEKHRTNAHVELHDRTRGVTVRLTKTTLQVRWDKDGKEAKWAELTKGHWKKRE